MYIVLHYYYQSLSNTKKEMTWKQQENIAYDTKIRYSWWITVAGQAFWHQVSRLSNIFLRPDFRLEFFRSGILEEFSRQIHMNFSCHQTATFSTAILIDWNSWKIPGSSAFFTGKYSWWHENPVFVMNYCSWASFLTSGCEIHIFWYW